MKKGVAQSWRNTMPISGKDIRGDTRYSRLRENTQAMTSLGSPRAMSRPIIEVDNVSKRYRLGQFNARTLREEAERWFRRHSNANGAQELQTDAEFWALKDISFSVAPGEVVGIIGRNGAGKSTLLKILSRITEPTSGEIRIRGRVASLLEVGTGFHPELTGRENIFLNGAILGMTRAEIKAKFDEIVAFAEIERFLDTPVKRYSSGMYVRLAFAVAAHLEPEILIVDEVLAVGDAEFQKKCLGKMREVSGKEGRMVLFVSHNMSAVRRLCSRAMVVDAGQIDVDGVTEEAIAHYLWRDKGPPSQTEWSWSEPNALGNPDIRIEKLQLSGSESSAPPFRPDEAISISVGYSQTRSIRGMRVTLRLVTTDGEIAFATSDYSIRGDYSYPAGRYQTHCRIPANLLNRREYLVQVSVGIPEDRTPALLPLTSVARFSVDGRYTKEIIVSDGHWPGAVNPRIRWSLKSLDANEQNSIDE